MQNYLYIAGITRSGVTPTGCVYTARYAQAAQNNFGNEDQQARLVVPTSPILPWILSLSSSPSCESVGKSKKR